MKYKKINDDEGGSTLAIYFPYFFTTHVLLGADKDMGI